MPAPILRPRGEAARVMPVELFFDLVYVFAITQLSHLLLNHLDTAGAAQTLLLTLAVWWAWMYTTWTTNYCDPDHPALRLTLTGAMLAGLVMAAALPQAFGPRAWWFAGAYVALQVGRTIVVTVAARAFPIGRTFRLVLAYHAVSAVLWIAGAALGGTAQAVLWTAALLVEYAAPWLGYRIPILGGVTPADWTIDGAHMAERCQLFVIIALGESVLVTGVTLAEHPHLDTATVAAFTVAFLASVATWWVYFHQTAEKAAEATARSSDTGRLGRSAYTYIHIPMVAGIIVAAVGDELVIAHPLDGVSAGTALTVLGGPALFLAGHALFQKAVFGRVPANRVAGIGVLAAAGLLVALAPGLVPPLVLAVVAALVLAAVAATDMVRGRSRATAGLAS
ncbi:low temperature requirement protein A [Nonomuraea sp. 3-1Str]|uniref:low temperature requirement protein A n=1 Tax=Nonomuraea sp. 3-1Str TaxID=2929801 RepID=UPI002857C3D1|nr:low temperature requirement protein A [Nonomuraea sp. 3-1Str]MDR8411330.1 low temperature requirement protein A [Nonomuraea sp. 3-1Str]